jgi:hypothetical protein
MTPIFFRYGSYRFVGYDEDFVPLIDAVQIHALRGFRGVKYIVDWSMMHAQEVWSENTSRDVRHRSRLIEKWEAKYPEGRKS